MPKDSGIKSRDAPRHRFNLGSAPDCRICAWQPKDRQRLMFRHLEGATYRELAAEFHENKDKVHRHLTKCEAANISRYRLHWHRAIDWQPILDELAQTGDDLRAIVTDASRRGDVDTMIKTLDGISDNIATRSKIADNVRKLEHKQLAEVVSEIAAAFVLHCPTKAPGLIAEIIDGRPAAQAILEDLTNGAEA